MYIMHECTVKRMLNSHGHSKLNKWDFSSHALRQKTLHIKKYDDFICSDLPDVNKMT